MKRFNLFALGVILLISLSCSSEKSNDTVDFIILQI
ncbi:MAG: hypothetical protein ACI905_001650, partial [Roseivirga sp.]